MTNAGGLTIPAKEFEGKLWLLADFYQKAIQAAYMGGVLAEREACAKRLDAIGCDHCAENIRLRGKE